MAYILRAEGNHVKSCLRSVDKMDIFVWTLLIFGALVLLEAFLIIKDHSKTEKILIVIIALLIIIVRYLFFR